MGCFSEASNYYLSKGVCAGSGRNSQPATASPSIRFLSEAMVPTKPSDYVTAKALTFPNQASHCSLSIMITGWVWRSNCISVRPEFPDNCASLGCRCGSVVECSASIQETLSSIPNITKRKTKLQVLSERMTLKFYGEQWAPSLMWPVSQTQCGPACGLSLPSNPGHHWAALREADTEVSWPW